MKQQFAWAIVTTNDKLALFSGECPIYWRRSVAKAECDRRNIHTSRPDYHVEKVTVLAVYR